MSGASMNEIKARMKSVRSTMQITGAMELVATSKLRRARRAAEGAAAFCRELDKVIAPLLEVHRTREDVLWLDEKKEGSVLYIVVAGDRGLAGGYNSNVLRLVRGLAKDEDAKFVTVGKKISESLRREQRCMFCDGLIAADQGVGDCMRLAKKICEAFAAGGLRRVELVYTEFVSILTQTPRRRTLLPFTPPPEGEVRQEPLMDGDAEALLERVIPEYLGGVLYYAVSQSVAAESAARRTAMNSANKNAAQMIDSLTLSYNRARQAVITQEITEIVSGAEAL